MSLACLLDLGLKSHSWATRSHSVPEDNSSMPCTKSYSAALLLAFVFWSCQSHIPLVQLFDCFFFRLCFLLLRIGIRGFQAFHLLFSPIMGYFQVLSECNRSTCEIAA
uniref:Uncharacterized protein n=1 Tax=Moschus moschiferus TaxID=68415 RepID=A0A8C6DTK4_MOSMO